MGERGNSCGAGRETETGNETDTLPLWEDGLSQSEQKRAKMKGRKPEKKDGTREITENNRKQCSEARDEGLLEKSKQRKKLQEYCAKDRENNKKMPYKSASYPLLQVKLQYTYVNTTPLFSTRGGGLRVVFNCMERFSVTQITNSSFH